VNMHSYLRFVIHFSIFFHLPDSALLHFFRWNGIRLVLKLFCNYVLSLHETFAIFMPFMALVVKAKEPHFVDFEVFDFFYNSDICI
jgi:hypothetical protein